MPSYVPGLDASLLASIDTGLPNSSISPESVVHCFLIMTNNRLKEETLTHERMRARLRLTEWGAAPLLYFALLPDKRYLSDPDHASRWSVAYRLVGRHALVLGDPMGDPAAAPEAISSFLEECKLHRWTPAFYQVTPGHLPTYRASGLRAVKVGEEARIVLNDFSLAGKRFKNLRNDLRRLEKTGVVLEEFAPGALTDSETIDEMREICAGWRRANRAGEAGFAMGAFDPLSRLFRESRTLAARDLASGQLLAFTTFVPAFGPGIQSGWTLDLMRRRANSPHGVMDFLIVSAAQLFAEEGAELLSLGLSPLAGADDPRESRQISLVRHFLYKRMGRVYNFQGLHTFKAKFATHWEPRYLISRPGTALAVTAGAVLKAHLSPLEPKKRHSSTNLRRRGLVLTALLVLLLSPFEKTLAKRAVSHPRRWAHFHAIHFHPHLLHFQRDRTSDRQFLQDGPTA